MHRHSPRFRSQQVLLRYAEQFFTQIYKNLYGVIVRKWTQVEKEHIEETDLY